MPSIAYDVLQSAYFTLDVGDVKVAFHDLSGLGYSVEVIEHKTMGENNAEIVRKVPGRLKWEDITIKSAITTDMAMAGWMKKVTDGDVAGARRDGTIVAFNQSGEEVAKWVFYQGWPSTLNVGSLSSDTGEIVMADMTVVHEGVMRIS